MEEEALSLQHVLGVSPSDVVFLSQQQQQQQQQSGDTGACVVAYAAGHTLVLHSERPRQAHLQTFLQGHCAAITCVVAPPDRAFLVTADAGTEASLLVVWDPATGAPIRAVTQPHAAGVLAAAVSADGQHLATISAAGSNSRQEVTLWDLHGVASGGSCCPPDTRMGADSSAGGVEGVVTLQPMCTAAVAAGDAQVCICFNSADACELVSNGPHRTLFWRLHRAGGSEPLAAEPQPAQLQLACDAPALRASDFQQRVGELVASSFLPGSAQAVSSTVDGDVVVWALKDDSGGSSSSSSKSGPPVPRRALKVVRLHGAAITHLSVLGDLLVTAGADGLVRMYDGGLRLCAWFESLASGPITALSFAPTALQQGTAAGNKREQQGCGQGALACMQLGRLAAPDFAVLTATGRILAVSADDFNTPDSRAPGGARLLVAAPSACLTGLATHPLRPELLLLASPSPSPAAAAPSSGSTGDSGIKGPPQQQQHHHHHHRQKQQQQLLMRWDLAASACVVSCALPADAGQCVNHMAMSRDGSFVVLGCSLGHVAVLHGDSLAEVAALRHTKHDLTGISVSSDGRLFAVADAAGSVLLYGHLPHKGALPLKWDLVGKFKAHHGAVVGLHFGESPAGQTRLFSVGTDCRLIEYDLAPAAAHGAGLHALTVCDCVAPGATGTPCAMTFAPPMPYYDSHASTTTLLLVADDAFKIKAFRPDTHGEAGGQQPAAVTPVATCLGPTFGGPLTKLLPFRPSPSSSGGSGGGAAAPCLAYSTAERVVGLIAWPLEPDSSMGLIAHADAVLGLALSCDGRQLITLGTQGIVNIWQINTHLIKRRQGHPQQQPGMLQLQGSASGSKAHSSRWASLIGDPGLEEELRDSFCYAQLASRPLDTVQALDIAGCVPAAALPDLMRAAGVWPSQAEVQGVLVHAQFLADSAPSDADCSPVTTGGSSTAASTELAVDLDTFLQLFLSHRRMSEVPRVGVEAAFATLAPSAGGVLDAAQLAELLQSGGEPFTQDELTQVLAALTGEAAPADALPERVDAAAFMSLLGFENAAVS